MFCAVPALLLLLFPPHKRKAPLGASLVRLCLPLSLSDCGILGRKAFHRQSRCPMALELIRVVTELPAVCEGVKLSCADVATLFALAHFGNLSEGGNAWPSVERLSAVSRLSERSLERAFLRLERAGLLARERRYNRTTLYRLDRLFALHLAVSGGVDRTRQNGGYVPAKSAFVPAILPSYPPNCRVVPAKLADYPLNDPLKDPVNNPPEAGRAKSAPPSPEAGGRRVYEGAAGAAPLGGRTPNRGGSGSTSSLLHATSAPEPFPEVSEDQRRSNVLRLRNALRGVL